MGKTYRIAVIGTGTMGSQHVAAWQLAGHEVVSVVDMNLKLAGEIADKYGIGKVYADYKEAIDRPEVDIVSICLPLRFHAPVTIFAASCGKHVFCEKPMTNSMQSGREMEEAVKKAGVHFGIGFQRTFSQETALYKQLVEDGKLGRPLVFSSDLLQEVRPKIAMHDADGNMGPLMDVGCHSFFTWQTVFQSRPKTAYACGMTIAADRPELAALERKAIDTVSAIVEFESGDIGEFSVSWGLPAKTKIRSKSPDRIVGPLGCVEATGGNKVNVYLGDQVEALEFARENLHVKQFAAFARSLDEGTPPLVGMREARQMLALTQALFKSIETGLPQPVEVIE
jgi:predicted dehydrogenase